MKTSKTDEKQVYKVVTKNPHHEGSNRFEAFSLIKNGVKVRQLLDKGVQRHDLNFMLSKGYVKLGNNTRQPSAR